MGGGDVVEGVPIVVEVVDHQALFLGVLIATHFPHHFR